MFQMCGVFAEFERGMIRERVISGQNRAKSQGKHIGRPTNLNEGLTHSIKYMKEQGVGDESQPEIFHMAAGDDDEPHAVARRGTARRSRAKVSEGRRRWAKVGEGGQRSGMVRDC